MPYMDGKDRSYYNLTSTDPRTYDKEGNPIDHSLYDDPTLQTFINDVAQAGIDLANFSFDENLTKEENANRMQELVERTALTLLNKNLETGEFE